MKLRNIKAHFNLDKTIDIDLIRKIFKACNATFTIHSHHKNVVHVTGVKSYIHLKLCIQYIENNFDVRVIESIIDNQFFSHKDNKVIDLKKIYEQLRETHIVFFEPELSPSMVIKHKIKFFPTILLFRTGSYTFLGGKMENIKFTNNFITDVINNNTIL